jgi:hypothetical protein
MPSSVDASAPGERASSVVSAVRRGSDLSRAGVPDTGRAIQPTRRRVAHPIRRREELRLLPVVGDGAAAALNVVGAELAVLVEPVGKLHAVQDVTPLAWAASGILRMPLRNGGHVPGSPQREDEAARVFRDEPTAW